MDISRHRVVWLLVAEDLRIRCSLLHGFPTDSGPASARSSSSLRCGWRGLLEYWLSWGLGLLASSVPSLREGIGAEGKASASKFLEQGRCGLMALGCGALRISLLDRRPRSMQWPRPIHPGHHRVVA